MKKRNKYERIQFVKDLGINTEENILIKPTECLDKYLEFCSKYEEYSLRTFYLDDKSCPHFPVLKQKELMNKIPELQKQGLYLIPATVINPKDCELAGCCAITQNKIFVEIAYGQVTVRKVSHDGIIDKFYDVDVFKTKTDDYRLNGLTKIVSDLSFANGINEAIYEFSYYNKPIGWKKEKLIVWEITGYSNFQIIGDR